MINEIIFNKLDSKTQKEILKQTKTRINYVFDVDGTLTPSRLKIDTEFGKFFRSWIKDKNVYLLTGLRQDY